MTELAIIGGTGLALLKTLKITGREIVHTPFGEPSGPVTHGQICGKEIVFIPRHGYGHIIPPHKINYLANMWALKELGAEKILAIAAVGGISANLKPGQLVIPDQIIDYTHSRVTTFFEEGLKHVTHTDFTEPYCADLREILVKVCKKEKIECVYNGTYGATQGPRLETAAEINRLERDGCTIVGMTGMPEAALARELGICYATCAVVANHAAGRGKGNITMEDIESNLNLGMDKVRDLIEHVIPLV